MFFVNGMLEWPDGGEFLKELEVHSSIASNLEGFTCHCSNLLDALVSFL